MLWPVAFIWLAMADVGSFLVRAHFWKCMLRSIRNVKLLKCVSLICLSPLFVFYFSRAFNLSLSPFKKTKSPTETAAESRLVRPRALDFVLNVWFCWREYFWLRMSCLSTMGSCSPVSWSRWVQTSRAERPSRRMREFVFVGVCRCWCESDVRHRSSLREQV